MNSDWFPSKRTAQTAMARRWFVVLKARAREWNIPFNEGEFASFIDEASRCLELAESSERNEVITAKCKTAFDNLRAYMRNLKARHFFSPPLLHEDYAALGLDEKDTTRTPVKIPTGQAEADISYPGVHMLRLRIRPVAGTDTDHKGELSYKIYYGILPHGGATVEEATGPKRYLMKAPISGEELPFDKETRRRNETFEFPAEESGKTAYFCIRYENSRKELGLWGPIFHAVIP